MCLRLAGKRQREEGALLTPHVATTPVSTPASGRTTNSSDIPGITNLSRALLEQTEGGVSMNAIDTEFGGVGGNHASRNERCEPQNRNLDGSKSAPCVLGKVERQLPAPSSNPSERACDSPEGIYLECEEDNTQPVTKPRSEVRTEAQRNGVFPVGNTIEQSGPANCHSIMRTLSFDDVSDADSLHKEQNRHEEHPASVNSFTEEREQGIFTRATQKLKDAKRGVNFMTAFGGIFVAYQWQIHQCKRKRQQGASAEALNQVCCCLCSFLAK